MTKSAEITDCTTKKPCCICGENHDYQECCFLAINSKIPDNKLQTRARTTLPTHLLETRKLADGSTNVFAKKLIKIGTEFGPFEAQKTLTLHPLIIFPLKVFSTSEHDLQEYFLDTTDENTCSWLMFVNAASDVDEQNMICYQNDNDLYYATIRDIEPGQALYVWYSPYYAMQMKKPSLKVHVEIAENAVRASLNQPPVDVSNFIKNQQNIVMRNVWSCKFCYTLETDVADFSKHLITHYKSKRKTKLNNKTSSEKKTNNLDTKTEITEHDIALEAAGIKIEDEMLKASEIKLESDLKVEELCVGGPFLLNHTDALDESSSLLISNLKNTDVIDNQCSLFSDHLNLSSDSGILSHTVKGLDHFNFQIKQETAPEEIVCDICLKKCSSLQAIITHLELHTGRHFCWKCKKVFARAESLKEHKCNKKVVAKCNLCFRLFSNLKYLNKHIASMHDKRYTCDKCKKYFYSAALLRKHFCSAVPVEELQAHKCEMCPKTFFNEEHLRMHQRNMHSNRKREIVQYVCPVCTKIIKGKSNCMRHMRSAHEKSEFECEICEKKFTRFDSLLMHKRVVHSVGANNMVQKFPCPICSKVFNSNAALKRHEATHKDENHQCTVCLAKFKQEANLNKHTKRVHSNTSSNAKKNYEFQCPVCLKGIKFRNSLRRHMRDQHPARYAEEEFAKVKRHPDNESCDTDQKCRDLKETIEDMDFSAGINSNGHDGNETIDKFLKESSEIVEDLYDNAVGNDGTKVQQQRNTEVCLSMPDLSDGDTEIQLGDNAYLMENGNIVEHQSTNPSNVVLYILNETKDIL